MKPVPQEPAPRIRASLPGDVVRAPDGQPAVVVVRTSRGWSVLAAEPATGWVGPADDLPADDDLTLVEAMSLADLVATELGVTPEPDRETRRAARVSHAAVPAGEPVDPRDEEVTGLRRTVGQLEHALAARVSIERAIGVLAERHCTTPREAFEELRRRARAQGRPAQELASEVLDALATRAAAVPGRRPGASPTTAGPGARSTPEPRPAGGPSSRRVQRNPRRPGGDVLPEALS
jgi:hypothetical protein